MTQFSYDVIVDINNPADDPFQISLRNDLINRIREVGIQTHLAIGFKGIKVFGNEIDLSGNQYWVNHFETALSFRKRTTYFLSISK